MDTERKIMILQGIYAGMLADAVLHMGKEGILEKVAKEKRIEQMKSGNVRAAQMGISEPKEVFSILTEIFGCANWNTTDNENGFDAEATFCKLCGIAKKMGADSPCNIYCLDPMEGMIKGIDNKANYKVHETLWEGKKCHVEIETSM